MDEVRLIEVKQDIHADNELAANELRERLATKKTFLLNLMSSPGAGKTTTILRTIDELRGKLEIGVIEADIDSMVDAEKVAAEGVSAVQLRTGGFCHLDAAMVAKGLDGLDLGEERQSLQQWCACCVDQSEFIAGEERTYNLALELRQLVVGLTGELARLGLLFRHAELVGLHQHAGGKLDPGAVARPLQRVGGQQSFSGCGLVDVLVDHR